MAGASAPRTHPLAEYRAEFPVFQRQDQPGRAALDEGRIVLARTEVARLDNDPNAPDRGVLTVIVESGDEPNC